MWNMLNACLILILDRCFSKGRKEVAFFPFAQSLTQTRFFFGNYPAG